MHAREVGHNHAEERRPHLHAARAPHHHRRDPPAARRAGARARVHSGAHPAQHGGHPGGRAPRRPLRHPAQLQGRGAVLARRPRARPLLLRQHVPARAARAAVHRHHREEGRQALPDHERARVREGEVARR